MLFRILVIPAVLLVLFLGYLLCFWPMEYRLQCNTDESRCQYTEQRLLSATSHTLALRDLQQAVVEEDPVITFGKRSRRISLLNAYRIELLSMQGRFPVWLTLSKAEAVGKSEQLNDFIHGANGHLTWKSNFHPHLIYVTAIVMLLGCLNVLYFCRFIILRGIMELLGVRT